MRVRGSSVHRGAVAVLLSLAGCARWPPVDFAALPREADHPGATGVVLLDAVTVDFHASSGKPVADVTHVVRARILRPGGEKIAHLGLHYDPHFTPVVDLRARVVTPDGATREFGRKDASDVMSFPGYVLYSDARALLLDLKPATPGAYVEYRYTRRYTEPRLLQVAQAFGGGLPTRRVRLEVSHPSDWRIEHLARSDGADVSWAPTITTGADGRTTEVWEKRDLPPFANEVQAPDSRQTVAAVFVRLGEWTERGAHRLGFRDARELSTGLHELVAGTTTPTPALRALAAAAVGGATDPETKARRLYSWVRDHVSYCAIEVGWGGWRPHPADEVRRVGYGDCKDKAALLQALLDVAGVPSRTARIYHHDGFPRRFGLPTISGNFNHAIVVVDLPPPRGPVFADPTSRTVPFGALPAGDQEAQALPLGDPGSDLVETPASPPEANRETTEIDLALSERSSEGRGGFRLEAGGALDERLRARLLDAPAGRRGERVGDWLCVRRPVVKEPVCEDLAPGDVPRPLVVSGDIQLEGVLGGEGATRLIRPADFVEPWVPALPPATRRAPVAFFSRMMRTLRLRFTVPEALAVSSLPPPARLDSRFGSYRLEWKHDGARLEMERTLVLREHVIAPADYDALRAFFDAIHAAEARPAVLSQRTGTAARAGVEERRR